MLKFNKEKFRKDLVVKRAVDLNLSTQELYETTKVPAGVIENIESGVLIPSVEDFVALCNFLETKRPGAYFSNEEETPVV